MKNQSYKIDVEIMQKLQGHVENELGVKLSVNKTLTYILKKLENK